MDLPQSCLDMNCSLAFSARKELVVGFEIFEGIYSHPGLRTPAECVCGKLLEHPIGTFISTEWASYKRKSTLFRGHTHNLRVGSWLMMSGSSWNSNESNHCVDILSAMCVERGGFHSGPCL
ncbi:uncharacterized protein LOC131225271 isoform X2 [Magnolia sinica]|uniref:uncharacterized protein LOC131225271 isoform X2 n=1 Tax=Magnolia sinica TaxID=86752 RepID=UPI002658AEF1|nr:uncharacterized protein LOC131225271 isoform X2 [Magnolia sinica]